MKKATLGYIDWQIERAEKEIEKLRKEAADFLKEKEGEAYAKAERRQV